MRIDLLITATSPISHHDPSVSDGSNMLTFNRQKQLFNLALLGPAEYDNMSFLVKHPVPIDMKQIFETLSFCEFVAVCMIKLLIDMYNSKDGTGLFAGMKRYQMLETRLANAGTRATSTLAMWNKLCQSLNLPVGAIKYDNALLEFLKIPAHIQSRICSVCAARARVVVTIARAWYTYERDNVIDENEYVTLDLLQNERSGAIVAEVPAISTNSLRHQLIRRPGWHFLARSLDLDGQSITMGAESIFENGGNIKAGAKQPGKAHKYAQIIRDTFPLLDLLGGVTDSFDIGESHVKCSATLVCEENVLVLPASFRVNPLPSAFDLLDSVTHTRQATSRGEGQMLYTFESLVAGTQILFSLFLHPFIKTLSIGAMASCLCEGGLYIGGQSARGYGHITMEEIDCDVSDMPGALDEYVQYLSDNKLDLMQYLIDGTLGCDAVVVS